MSSQRDIYKYKPLPKSRSVRLLHLSVPKLPRPGHKIQAVLVEIDLDAAKKLGYEALSYVWGRPIFTHRLYFQDKSYLPITTSLHSAIASLAESTPRTIWIDAVCINQADPDEKARQIPLMYEIFSQATRVIAWLGLGDDLLSSALREAPALKKMLIALKADGRLSGIEARKRYIEATTKCEWDTLVSHLVKQEWFHRLWVVQEIVAASEVVLTCDSCTLPLETLTTIMALEAWLNEPAKWQGTCRLLLLRARYKGGWNTSDNTQMIQLLSDTSGYGCFDDRDRLFALAGITTLSNALPYCANYTKSLATVYTDFAIHQLSVSSSCYFLVCARHRRENSIRDIPLPSWVPDWRRRPRYMFSTRFISTGETLYNAHGGQAMFIPGDTAFHIEARRILSLGGIFVDSIEEMWCPTSLHLSSKFPEGRGRKGVHAATISLLRELLITVTRYTKRKISWSMLWRTLFADMSPDRKQWRRAIESESGIAASCITILLALDQRNANLRSTPQIPFGKTLHDFCLAHDPGVLKCIGLEYIQTGASGRLDTLQQECLEQLSSRIPSETPIEGPPITRNLMLLETAERFGDKLIQQFYEMDLGICITSAGRLGWVPRECIPGDTVAILSHETPFILRKCDQNVYKLIGESYIHGIMDGEALEGNPSVEEIRIV